MRFKPGDKLSLPDWRGRCIVTAAKAGQVRLKLPNRVEKWFDVEDVIPVAGVATGAEMGTITQERNT